MLDYVKSMKLRLSVKKRAVVYFLIAGSSLNFIYIAGAQTPGGAYQEGTATCTLSIGSLSFPSVAAGVNSVGMNGTSSFSVSCSNYPKWVTGKGGSAGPFSNSGLPFCVVIKANASDSSYTAAEERVLWRDGKPGNAGEGNAMTFNLFTNYTDCSGQNTHSKTNSPFCVWGSGIDQGDYGVGYPSYMFSSGLLPNHFDNTHTLSYGATIDAGQNIWAGAYSNSFTATLVYNDSLNNPVAPLTPGGNHIVDPASLCMAAGPGYPGSKTDPKTLTVTAAARSNCRTVTTDSITFKKVINMADIQPEQGVITAGCSNGVSYQLGLSKGNNSSGDPAQGGWRGMGCSDANLCGDAVIYYNIWKNSGRTQPWGDIGSADVYKGKVSSGGQDRVPFYVMTAPESTQSSLGVQMPPKPGTYTDVVVVTLQSQINGTTQ